MYHKLSDWANSKHMLIQYFLIQNTQSQWKLIIYTITHSPVFHDVGLSLCNKQIFTKLYNQCNIHYI